MRAMFTFAAVMVCSVGGCGPVGVDLGGAAASAGEDGGETSTVGGTLGAGSRVGTGSTGGTDDIGVTGGTGGTDDIGVTGGSGGIGNTDDTDEYGGEASSVGGGPIGTGARGGTGGEAGEASSTGGRYIGTGARGGTGGEAGEASSVGGGPVGTGAYAGAGFGGLGGFGGSTSGSGGSSGGPSEICFPGIPIESSSGGCEDDELFISRAIEGCATAPNPGLLRTIYLHTEGCEGAGTARSISFDCCYTVPGAATGTGGAGGIAGSIP